MATVIVPDTPIKAVYLTAVNRLHWLCQGFAAVDWDKVRVRDAYITTKVLRTDPFSEGPELKESVLLVKKADEFKAVDIGPIDIGDLHIALAETLRIQMTAGLLDPKDVRVTYIPLDEYDDEKGRYYYLEITLKEADGYRAVWSMLIHDGLMSDDYNIRRINGCVDELLLGLDRCGVKLNVYARLPRTLSMHLQNQINGFNRRSSKEFTFSEGKLTVTFSKFYVARFVLTVGGEEKTHITSQMGRLIQLYF